MDLLSFESKLSQISSIDEKIRYLVNFLQVNDLLNIYFRLSKNSSPPTTRIYQIGAPEQIIMMIRRGLNVSLESIDIKILDMPVLRRVYTEQKNIYFKKVPRLIAGLIPQLHNQRSIEDTLRTLGITDVAVLPILNTLDKEVIGLLAVLGPLTQEQMKQIKEIVLILQKSIDFIPDLNSGNH